MNTYSFLLGIVPLILFVVIDSFMGLRAGIIAAILFAIGELAYSLVVFHEIDGLTIGSTVLILFFGWWSLRANHPIYIKLQPVVLGVVFGIITVAMQLLEQPLFVVMAQKYQYLVPDEYRHVVMQPAYLNMLARVSGALGIGLLVHAALTAYAAFCLSKWWWLFIRGVGLYAMVAVCVLYVRFV